MIIDRIMESQLTDLGIANSDERYSGILVPVGETQIGPGVTKQFLEDAETYHRKYFDIGYMKYLLDGALKTIMMEGKVDLALDIGSGSGPSVLALLDRLSDAYVVATDISPNLLAILRQALREKKKLDRCSTLCLDLNRPWFAGQPFDLAVGSAILHHLFDPSRLVEEVFLTVRPGGALIFFEPFEAGHAIMRLIYRTILAQANHSNPLPGNVADFFHRKIIQLAQMTCEEKDQILYANVDDKWAFTSNYFMNLGAQIGASKTIVYPINHSDQPFSNHLKTTLRLGLGLDVSTMPEWVLTLVADIENSMSDACKRDLLLEGCVAFVK
ncbi:unnamed protein product [Sphagnum tenellum]